MNNILAILLAALALCIVIDCKDLRSDNPTDLHTLCDFIDCAKKEVAVRSKRDAVGVLGAVGQLVTGIVNASFKGVERVQRHKRKKTVLIGPGRNNKNKVYINRRYNYA